MSNVLVSIIVPCYNTESTLEETLISIVNQKFQDWEAIIINDGSPDNLEKIALQWVNKDSRFRYYKKENGGLGSARNFGIKNALGEFILPLDSDNLIRENFVSHAIPIFLANPKVGVIYGNANYIGGNKGIWKVGAFDRYKMLYDNYIDACVIIKKEVFDLLGSYEENLPHQGHEDWELWLRIIQSKSFSFYYLDELTFDYRIADNSMIRLLDEEKKKENMNFIRLKHSALYVENYISLYVKHEQLKKEIPILFNTIRKKINIISKYLFNTSKD